jgi:hypothetical protein
VRQATKPVAAAPVAAQPRTSAAPSEAKSEEEKGWVSDLLRRASRDEENHGDAQASGSAEDQSAQGAPAQVNGATPPTNGATPPPPAPGEVASAPLNALSVDIARAIDHQASVELWERHRRGEKNLFTRRLYTLQGQQTFDEIRRKYQRDEEFRTAVDRYIRDFESLLEEVTRSNKAASGTYLTSDTGKVYTMLAHASGRFD